MSELEIALLVVVIVMFLAVMALIIYFVLNKKKKPESSKVNEMNVREIMSSFSATIESFNSTLNAQTQKNNEQLISFERAVKTEIDKMNEKVENRITDLNAQVNKNIAKNAEDTGVRMEKIAEQIGEVKQAQSQLGNLHSDINGLQRILQGNQTRGQYGERTLSLILFNVFGESGVYEEQYSIKNNSGEVLKPDAVVFCPEPYNLICIDSKFPFAQYEVIVNSNDEERSRAVSEFEKAVKLHIDVVSKKYIINGKTAPFAFLFIPNDAIFMFLHSEADKIIDYAEKKKVILTSPSTLYPFLSTIYTLNIDYKRSKNIQKMMESFEKVFKEFETLQNSWDGCKTTLLTFQKKVDDVDTRINRSIKAVKSIEGIDTQQEIENFVESK